MKKNESIVNVMTEYPISVQITETVSTVRKIMIEKNIHHIPILDKRQLVGLISFTDMLKLNILSDDTSMQTIDARLDEQFTINDVMTPYLSTLKETHKVRHAVEALAKGKFHSIPITDNAGHLVGIVTSTDLIRYLYEQY